MDVNDLRSAVTLLSLLLFIGLMTWTWWPRRQRAHGRRVMANDNTTGHVWDEDLRELNNPLPRWWMGLFVLTVVFAAAYLALYPGMGSAAGKLGWTSVSQYEQERAKARAATAPL